MLYKAEFENACFEIIYAFDDNDASDQALDYEYENGSCFRLTQVNEDYEEIREVW